MLVNNAGGQFLSPAEAISPKGFRTVIELNVQGTWLMTHAAATKAFIPQGGGKILSVTLSPHNGMPGMVHSGAARAAVENMMRTLAIEWARFGITTCALAAGQFATETLLTKYPQVVVDNVERSIPLGRTGRPEEIAWLLAYLASPAGDFFSGTTITIDGARDNWVGPWPPQRSPTGGRRPSPRSAAEAEFDLWRYRATKRRSGRARARPAGSRGRCCGPVVRVAGQTRSAFSQSRGRSSAVASRARTRRRSEPTCTCDRVAQQVVEPGGVLREAAFGGDEDEVLPVLDEEQGGGAQRGALGADVVEQQHPPLHAGDRAAEAPARPPVEEGVGARQPVGDRPELIRYAR